jgi:hypothetical protein
MRPFSITALNTAISAVSSPVDIRFMHVLGTDISWGAFVAIPEAFDVATGTPFNITTNAITAVAHGLVTGQVVKPTIDDGSLPDPLVSGTEYFAIKLTDNTFKLATSMVLALAGTGIDLVDQGTDSQVVTFTPQANVGTVVVESCTDLELVAGSTWRTLDSVNLVSDSSPDVSKLTYVNFHWVRATISVSKGALASSCKVVFFGK